MGSGKRYSAFVAPANKWYFEAVFDYGDHDEKNPLPDDYKTTAWKPRNDPFLFLSVRLRSAHVSSVSARAHFVTLMASPTSA